VQKRDRNVIDEVKHVRGAKQKKGVVKGKRRRFFLICNLQNYVGEQNSVTILHTMCTSTLCTFIITFAYETGKTNRRRQKGLN
jgi:hypothetical protein